MTPPGIVNLVTVLGGLAVVLTMGITDAWQALVRTWDSSYRTGLPSTLDLFLIYALLAILCVLILTLLRPQP